jgi:hypothetical protein
LTPPACDRRTTSALGRFVTFVTDDGQPDEPPRVDPQIEADQRECAAVLRAGPPRGLANALRDLWSVYQPNDAI